MGGVGPISFLALDRAADRFGFDSPEDFEDFFTKLRLLDRHWLSNFAPGSTGRKRKQEETDERPGSQPKS